jgi:hypothetical protein
MSRSYRYLFIFLISVLSINLNCFPQNSDVAAFSNVKWDFVGVYKVSDTIVQVFDYFYVPETRSKQRIITVLVSNKEVKKSDILGKKSIYVGEKDIYIIDDFGRRRALLPFLRVDLEEKLFRHLYSYEGFTPQPDYKDIIEKWENKNTVFMRYFIKDLRLAVFEVDIESLNQYLTLSRSVTSERKNVKIGLLVGSDFKID